MIDDEKTALRGSGAQPPVDEATRAVSREDELTLLRSSREASAPRTTHAPLADSAPTAPSGARVAHIPGEIAEQHRYGVRHETPPHVARTAPEPPHTRARATAGRSPAPRSSRRPAWSMGVIVGSAAFAALLVGAAMLLVLTVIS